MGDLTVQYRSTGENRAVRPLWIRLEKFISDFGREIVGRRKLQKIAIVQEDYAKHGLAQARGALNNRIEHRLGICRRSGDDVKHLARRSLMFERVGQLALLRLHLIEQPHVLDRDHRLVSKGSDQLDLLVGKRLDPLSRDCDHPDRHLLAQQRHAQHGTTLSKSVSLGHVIFRIREYIYDMDGMAFERGSARNSGAAWR